MNGAWMSEAEFEKILLLLSENNLNIPNDCPALYAAFERFAAAKEEEWKLAEWIEEAKRNRWKLSPAQRAMLESIPGWTWRPGSCDDHQSSS